MKISVKLPQRQQFTQSLSLLRNYLHLLDRKNYARTHSTIESSFYDIILDALKNDRVLEAKCRCNRDGAKMLIMEHFLTTYDHFVHQQLMQTLFSYSTAVSQSVLIGSNLDLYSHLLCVYEHNNKTYLDVGRSYFQLQFWRRVYEHIELEQREHLLVKEERHKIEEKTPKIQYQQTGTQTEPDPTNIMLLEHIAELEEELAAMRMRNRLDDEVVRRPMHREDDDDEGIELQADVEALRRQFEML